MTARWHFANQPDSIGAARRVVTQALTGEAPELIEKARLLVSELATNALCHARTEFDVSVDRVSASIHIAVRDTGGGEPSLRTPSLSETSGRGLQILNLLADAWGVEHGPGWSKTVWFTLVRKPLLAVRLWEVNAGDGDGDARSAGAARISGANGVMREVEQPSQPAAARVLERDGPGGVMLHR